MIIVTKRPTTLYKLLFFLILSIVLFSGINTILVPKNFELFFDPIISTNIQDQIKDQLFMLKPQELRKIGATQLFYNLKQNFKLLSSVAIAYSASQSAKIILQAEKPILNLKSIGCKTQNECSKFFILTHSDNIVSNLDYNFSENNLKNIYFKKYSNLFENNQELAKFSKYILENKILENFEVTWIHQNEIILESKDSKLILIVEANSEDLLKKIDCAKTVYNLKESELKRKIEIDLRYNDFLVLKPEGKI